MTRSRARFNHGWGRKGYGTATACSRRARTELSFCLGERILDSAPVPRTPHRQLFGGPPSFFRDLTFWFGVWTGRATAADGRPDRQPQAQSGKRPEVMAERFGGERGLRWCCDLWAARSLRRRCGHFRRQCPRSAAPAGGVASTLETFQTGKIRGMSNRRSSVSMERAMGGESVLAAPVVVTRRHYSCFMQSKCAPQFVRRLDMNSWGFVQCEASRFWGVSDIFPVRANEW